MSFTNPLFLRLRRRLCCPLGAGALILSLALGVLHPGAAHCAETPRLTLPVEALAALLTDLLPLPLGPVKDLEGRLVLGELKNLKLADNRISADVRLDGNDLRYNVAIGGNRLALDVGNVTLPLHVVLGLSLDQAAQKIVLTPTFKLRADNQQEGKAVQPLMDLLAREPYLLDPAPWLSPVAQIGGRAVRFNLKITDLFTAQNKLFISFDPRAQPSQ